MPHWPPGMTHWGVRGCASDGNQVLGAGDVEGGEGYFKVSVPEGQDGSLWKMEQCYGAQMLMTVPPYLAHNEQELLVPREVVERDSADRE